MAKTSNAANITLRSDLNRELTYEEGDDNFRELKNVIADLDEKANLINPIFTNNINWGGVATGNGSGITNLNATNLSTGTINSDRLPYTTVTPGTYNTVTVDNKGRITYGYNKTTLATLGITGNQALTGDLAITGKISATGNVDYTGTGYTALQAGTTVQRPLLPRNGMIRYNTDIKSFEGYVDNQWGGVGGAQANGAIYENSNTINTSYTLTVGKNGLSAGPITLQDGVTISIPDGSIWVIV